MPRRRRSFFFDNINKRLLVDTFKNARTSKAEIDAGTVTADDILKKSQIDSDVDASLANLVNTAPATLDTLDELAAALGDDANFATTTSTALGNRLRIDVNNQGLNATQLSNARTNLGLGTAATTASTDYATAAQGAKADTAHGWGNHANAGYGTSNFSGAYADLTGKPSLFSGSYNDLSNKPTIPTNNNQLTNGAGYITSETFAVRGTMSNADASQASGVYRINTGVTSQPGGSVTDYGTVVHFNNVSDTGFQIACDYNSASFYFRGGNSSTFGGSGTNQAWSKVWCDNNDGSGSGLDADTVDGIQGASFARNDTNVTIDNGTSTTVTVLCDNSGEALLALRGDGQGTGRLFVGQSNSYGGGIEYNGDNSPATTGAGADWIALYRVDAGTLNWTARNKYNSNDWQFRGNVTAYASDERLKENIQVIPNALEKVASLKGVTFDWKADVEEKGFLPSQKHETGVIAQDVAKVVPDAAVPAPFDENYLTVQHEKLIPLLIEAIKEQQKQIEELKEIIGGTSE